MSDEQARRVYAEARIGKPIGLRERPAILVVDGDVVVSEMKAPRPVAVAG